MDKEFKSLMRRVNDYSTAISEERLAKAYDFAKKAYDGQVRLSGDSVLSHVLETAKILSTLKVDEETIVAALLHEIPKTKHYKVGDLEKNFGKNVALLVSAFEKISTVKIDNSENEIETLRKMLLVMARDLRVVLIKIADRLHNMQTLEYHTPAKRKKIARETLDILVPIASRLGVYTLRSTLEDLCFKYLYNKDYKNIQEELKVLGKKRKNAIDEIQTSIEEFLEGLNIKADISGRFKNTFSIYKKLKKKGKTSIDDIHDIFALRVIVPTVFLDDGDEDASHLYSLIGHIHNKWKPLPKRFKDYVGFPKPNGYKSLHTTVIGMAPHSLKEPVEIQIRTEKMHEEAEYGIASHWLYKESKGSEKSNNVEDKQFAQIEWIKSLESINSNFDKHGEEEVMKELKLDLFQDRIFAFTPTGDVRDLPIGSNAIDFAYSIHTDLGHKCTGAKSNGCIIPLDQELANGQVVEILTRPDSKPKLEWLASVKTSSARAKIKTFFRAYDKDENFKRGRDILNEKLADYNKPKLDQKFSVLKYLGKKRLSFKEREELIKQVGAGAVIASSVVKKVFSVNELYKDVNKSSKQKAKITLPAFDIDKRIFVGGEKGLPIRIAKCCKPQLLDPITGFITRGKAVSIHKEDCRILKLSNEARHIEASWDNHLSPLRARD